MNLVKNMACQGMLSMMLAMTSTPSPALAESSSELMERAVYIEESKGELKAAIKLYEKVIGQADASKQDIAQALYRQAVCYHLLGDKQKSINALTRLINQYPAQASLVSKAKTLMLEVNAEDIALLPTPWEDGEELHYSIRIPSGKQMGSMVSTVKKTDGSSRPIWTMENYIAGGNQLYTQSSANLDNLFSISSASKSPQFGTSASSFDSNSVKTRYNRDGEDSETKLDLKNPAFDMKLLPYLLRRLPLNNDYSTSISLYENMSNGVYDANISVVGQEVIKTAGQEFDCFKIKLVLSHNGRTVQESLHWVENSGKRYYLKEQSNGTSIQLQKIAPSKTASKVEHRFDKLNFKFSTQAARKALDLTFKDDSVELLLGAFDSNMDTPIYLTVITPEKDDTSANLRVPGNKRDYQVNRLKSRLDNFSLRSDVAERTIGGLSTHSFVADFTQKSKEKVMARVFFANNDQLFYFSIITDKAKYERVNAQLQDIMNSFEIL
ncbi:tol-pal system YbgF family protein [Pleionea sp. CnH1-48]|uniref:tetratricopeptide repeat protein n=1 Tax=Pleionea sp. CnH1-48 TaxID=2954494 RepID=UPI002097CB53|nr:tetratricopeptide repeat protein [Pleionea sp. CnH1-48]MCO7223754.1 tetratricopeptide repeat protein [Pleionea sp. CnH1-48]